MTKEELEKEAEEYLENEHCKNVCTHSEVEECKKGIRIKCMSFNCRKELIVNFAELREKHIEELEQQIEEMKCCYNCKQTQDETYCKIKKSDVNDLSCWDCGCDKWEIREK